MAGTIHDPKQAKPAAVKQHTPLSRAHGQSESAGSPSSARLFFTQFARLPSRTTDAPQ